MKISELIEILQAAPDKNAEVYLQNGDLLTNAIGVCFSANNDVKLYEVDKQDESTQTKILT